MMYVAAIGNLFRGLNYHILKVNLTVYLQPVFVCLHQRPNDVLERMGTKRLWRFIDTGKQRGFVDFVRFCVLYERTQESTEICFLLICIQPINDLINGPRR